MWNAELGRERIGKGADWEIWGILTCGVWEWEGGMWIGLGKIVADGRAEFCGEGMSGIVDGIGEIGARWDWAGGGL